MVTSASRSRMFPARSRKSYRLEMEGRTLYVLLSLMALTGLVIFYLGVVTGKAIRDPNTGVTLSAEMPLPASEALGERPAGRLAVGEALRSTDSVIEGLRLEEQSVSERTRTLLSRAQKQLELEEVAIGETGGAKASRPPAAPAPARADPKPAPASGPAQPAHKAAPSGERGGLFTVQVFSSQYQQRARDLMDRLKGQGFSAYLNRFQAADKQVWYRVRVGKSSRAEAEALSARLKAEAKLKDPQVRKL